MSIVNIKNHLDKREEIIQILTQLTSCPVIDADRFNNIINNLNNNHNIYIYIKDNRVIGIITLLIEQKLIHNGACVAHIEDLVVDKNYQKQGIARELVKFCLSKLSTDKHYKIILNCSNELKEFYEKLGFENKNIQMAKYLM
jgi:glucosamine-phosphate N-acetyltransferase